MMSSERLRDVVSGGSFPASQIDPMDWKNLTPSQVREWMDRIEATPAGQPTLGPEDRRSLQKVSNMIEELEKMGVAPPDQLLHQRDQLRSKSETSAQKLKVAESDLASLDTLISEYSLLLKAAREKRDHLHQISSGGGKKHYGVTLSDLLAARYISPKDELELRWLKDGPTFNGAICDDGTILVDTGKGWKRYESLSTAATEIAGRALNGWEVWSLAGPHGKRTQMTKVRARYMEANQGNSQP